MIPKSQMYLGARIVENDPEEETPVVPYKGCLLYTSDAADEL